MREDQESLPHSNAEMPHPLPSPSSCLPSARRHGQFRMPMPLPVTFGKTPSRTQEAAPPSSTWQSLNAQLATIELAPPTPPEELGEFNWTTSMACSPGSTQAGFAPSEGSGIIRSGPSREQNFASTGRPSAIHLPTLSGMEQANEASPSWLEAAANTIVELQAQPLSSQHIQMVVQALPSQRKGSQSRPIFEQLAGLLQQHGRAAPYITITHVVSSLLSLGDVPSSPPATPNQLNTSDSYFDGQTIFTHAATAPIYHPLANTPTESLSRGTGIVTAPASVHISTLERYIPPTTGEEVQDFFTLSRKSYLVDRMTELSPRNGTLLLVYPTANGAATFANEYIGPVIEPFLRRFCLVNDLSMDAASRMGNVAAASAMMSFDEMSTCIDKLCIDIAERAPVDRGPRSKYSVIHQEKVEMTIDRETWVEWFVEQESPRLRQDMVDYQMAGGRLSTRRFDTTPASLAREVIEGIRGSTEVAGGQGIELGVFLIRRSMP